MQKRLQADSQEKYGRGKDSEDCPPSYTEAVKSHLSHHHRSSNHRHRHSPTSGGSSANTSPKNSAMATSGVSGRSHHHHHHRFPRTNGGMQHLLDLGPESAPGGQPVMATSVSEGVSSQSHFHHSKYSHHPSSQRTLNHHSRRRGDSMDSSSPHKSRPGRNLLAATSTDGFSSSQSTQMYGGSHSHHSPHHSAILGNSNLDDFGYPQSRKDSLEGREFGLDSSGFGVNEKSPSSWRSSSHRDRDVSCLQLSILKKVHSW